ncbi:splicing factor, proline- and glutamine-rich-like [Passer montanus]|uniref:splicing factor, proline- and glutamine-rich-like n=1 Tax=Passer montanus TaxID=9160 RepID=UPI001960D2B6|nr:splicing factor, proline- and glutamine-rich-like [Passer montanus]
MTERSGSRHGAPRMPARGNPDSAPRPAPPAPHRSRHLRGLPGRHRPLAAPGGLGGTHTGRAGPASRASARHFRDAPASPRQHRETPPRLARDSLAHPAVWPSPFGNFRHRQTLPIGRRSASMRKGPPRGPCGAEPRGAGVGSVRRPRRRARAGGAQARGRGGGEACGDRLIRPGHGASPPPRHGSPCPCSSPLSERKWPPPPSQRPQPPPPPQHQRGRHLGEAGAGSAPRQETGNASPGNAGREAGWSKRGSEPRRHPQPPAAAAASPPGPLPR